MTSLASLKTLTRSQLPSMELDLKATFLLALSQSLEDHLSTRTNVKQGTTHSQALTTLPRE
jgi:hypothetical protein